MNQKLPLWVCLSLGLLGEGMAQDIAFASTQLAAQQPTGQQALLDVLKRIERQFGVVFDYNRRDLRDKLAPATLPVAASLEQTLQYVLAPSGLSFEKNNARSYLIYNRNRPTSGERPPSGNATTPQPPTGGAASVSSTPLYEQRSTDREVTGRVMDGTKNEGLPGVNVSVKGTSRGTTTDADGRFRLNVPDGVATLVFSFIGYTSQEVALGNRGSLEVSLQPSDQTLNEVVIVGYGTVRKSDLTGSVGQFKNEGANERPAASVDQLLQGRTSGVQITQNSGAPGSGMSFLIRGAGSLTGSNQPLIVLDGYPIETSDRGISPNSGANQWTSEVPPTNALANLNPSDIESIEILKDASATAIYGSRGANGVVLINTKRGRAGRDRIDFSFRTDFSQLPRQLPMLNTQDYIAYANEARLNSGLDTLFKVADRAALANTNINWQDLIYRTAQSQDYQLAFSGGDDKTKYTISTNYTHFAGIVQKSSFDRGSLRLNIDRQMSSRLSLRASVNASMSTNKAAQQSNSNGHPSGSIITGTLVFRPIDLPFSGEEDDPNPLLSGNPLTLVNLQTDQNRSRILLLNLSADYKLTKELIFRVNGGVNETNSLREAYIPRGTFAGDASGGTAFRGTSGNFNYLAEYTLNYNHTFANKHRINAVAGYTWQAWTLRTSGIQATSFPSDNLTFYNFQIATNSQIPITNTSKWALASYLGRVNYAIDDRYLLTFTGRADGSTRLSEGNKWAFFPSVAVGWNVHNEAFMPKSGIISELKVRGSFGLTGNQSIGVGSSQDALGINRTTVNGTIVTALVPGRLGNPNLQWETTRQVNVGADLGLLNNRFRLGIELYRRRTRDLLLNLGIPGSSGFITLASNIGEIENKGLEIETEARLLTAAAGSKGIGWTASGNISFNRNKIISLNQTQLFGPSYLSVGTLGLNQPLHTAVEGYPIGSFFGYRMNGIYQNADELKAGPADATNPQVGGWRYADINGDNVINAADRTIIGNPYPKFTFGVTNDLRWRAFSLTVFFMGNLGQQIINLNRYYTDALALTTNANVSQRAFDGRWRGEGTSNTYARPLATGLAWRQRFSDFIVEDGSFVRLKTLTLGYSLPARTVKFMNSAKVFVTATNLLTFTKYTGYDPEVSATATNALAPGVDFGTIPQFRTLSAGVSLGF